MNSGKGSQELTRVAAAYVTSIAFALAFLCAEFAGVDGMTALWRGVVAALYHAPHCVVTGWLLKYFR